LAVAQRKPGALRNGAPFIELPEAFRTFQLKKPGGDREMVDILALVLQRARRWHSKQNFFHKLGL
jgi:hypothetical protein